ncbi:MAG: hypothetical protein AB7G93_10415 [Bdellovibrionales bacterium]
MARPDSEVNPFINYHLELLFGASTALAFTFWQHLAVLERLSELSEWQLVQPALWYEIREGRKICGLATTHLAAPAGAGVHAKRAQGGYLLQGKASWVCGFQIFDLLLIGFNVGESNIFAMINFPSPLVPDSMRNVSVEPLKMACLNGSGTVELTFEGLHVEDKNVICCRPKYNGEPATRPTQFIIPEIGISKSVITRVEKIIENSFHPRHQLIGSCLADLKARVKRLEELRAQSAELQQLIVLRDELNRDAIRILTLTLGAKSILSESHVPRLLTELLLFDSILQPPAAVELKIKATARGSIVHAQ